MREIASKAAALWPLDVSEIVFAAHRENAVYKITANNAHFALRLHRPGYRTQSELVSELQWMAALAQSGMMVPKPISSRNGRFIEHAEGHDVSLLTWLSGMPLGKSGMPLDLPNTDQVFFNIGRETARLHLLSDAWRPPPEFQRHHWNRDGLLGETPVWGRFWDNSGLTPGQAATMVQVVERAEALFACDHQLDYGLIHADLLRENILMDGHSVCFIDFDDGGYGYRLFELATTLHRHRHEPHFDELESALLSGYRSLRTIDTTHLKLFIALRAFTYLGWIMPRLSEPDKAARNPKLIAEAMAAAAEAR